MRLGGGSAAVIVRSDPSLQLTLLIELLLHSVLNLQVLFHPDIRPHTLHQMLSLPQRQPYLSCSMKYEQSKSVKTIEYANHLNPSQPNQAIVRRLKKPNTLPFPSSCQNTQFLSRETTAEKCKTMLTTDCKKSQKNPQGRPARCKSCQRLISPNLTVKQTKSSRRGRRSIDWGKKRNR